MSNKFLLFLLLCLTVLNFNQSAAAQTVGEGTTAVSNSNLTTINLAEGARRVKNGMEPSEVREVLEKLVAQGGERVKQGNSEVLLWGGDYTTARGEQMIEKIAADLKKSGWEYELAAKEKDVTIFMLMREEPSRKAIVGFFAPMKEAFIFAVTEMLPANAEVSETTNADAATGENTTAAPDNSAKSSSVSGNEISQKLVGKWMRSTGAGGNDDGTGKTRYNSGTNTTFEFRADGTMMFTIDKQALAITQCTVSEITKLPGTYSTSGDQLTLNLSAGISTGKSTCDRAGNFNKKLTASTLQKSFVIRKMQSVFRPDEPLLLCFDGTTKDDECFERDPKS